MSANLLDDIGQIYLPGLCGLRRSGAIRRGIITLAAVGGSVLTARRLWTAGDLADLTDLALTPAGSALLHLTAGLIAWALSFVVITVWFWRRGIAPTTLLADCRTLIAAARAAAADADRRVKSNSGSRLALIAERTWEDSCKSILRRG